MYELTSRLPAWAPYAVTATCAALIAAAAVWAGTRRHRPPNQATTGRASRGDLAAAAIATAVSAEGMWETFSALDMPVPLRAATFAFIELAILQSARRARRSMADKYSAGIDGIAMWVLTLLTAVLSAAHELATPHPNTAVVLVRLAAPPVAAWGWERNMALERRVRGLPTGVNWRVTPERVLCWLGLAEPLERTASDVDEFRRINRVAVATARLEEIQAGGRHVPGARRRAAARLRKAMREALEHTGLADDPGLQERLMAATAALTQAATFAEVTHHPFWSPAPATHDPRPRICSGAHAGPRMVGLRLRDPGRGFRTLHPTPAPGAEAGPSATTVTLLERIRERRAEKRLGVRSAPPRAGTDLTQPRPVPPLTPPDQVRQTCLTEEPTHQTQTGLQTGPSLNRSRTHDPAPTQTQVPDQPADRSDNLPADPAPGRSGGQVPDQPPAEPASEMKQTRTGPRTSRKKTDPFDRLGEAIAADLAYLDEHGRHIPAEKLARALSIGKPAALALTRHIRSGPTEMAK